MLQVTRITTDEINKEDNAANDIFTCGRRCCSVKKMQAFADDEPYIVLLQKRMYIGIS